MTQICARLQLTVAALPLLVVLVLALLLTGCEQNARSLASVNETTPRDALQTFLTTWKDGKKPADLPKMTGMDSEWDQGKALESFEILPGERTDGANLFLKVRRKVKSKKGVLQDQEVEYVVGTSPVVTVFRSDQ